MAAVVEIDEQNGPAGSSTVTHNIANSNMGSKDAVNLDPVTAPIVPGENTCEKWQLFHVTDMGTSSRINNIKVWRAGDMGSNAIHLTNAAISGYAGAATYATPTTATSTVANKIMPSSLPDTANIGIGGSLTGYLANAGYSDFFVHQVQTNSKALSGSTSTINYQYDEIA